MNKTAYRDKSQLMDGGRKFSSLDVVDRLLPTKKAYKILKKNKDLNPMERLILQKYIRYNGSVRKVKNDLGITRRTVYQIMGKKNVKKAVRLAFKKLGIDLVDVLSTIVDVMDRKGDYHYDFNRLKAADLILKLAGVYAPKEVKHKHSGEITQMNKMEIKAVLVSTVNALRAYDAEKFPKLKDGSSLPATDRSNS